ncbi:glycoside hydrolase family 75 protein [Thermothelomyces thermophilus ATCC 42464]|uniref:Endo-chitosanase n=1 Tax=Thermothelomyces thermophilus (strain ATCC 42464 / BCRC 31852 / DSM 1799) TaxID=573729 RepID=G2QIJ9_THET4|nr:glycoside hydrolase family 75 protein [Thermothelomyces thermophilus ATCC 42464]AEO59530.1 glycoside hydrolase family 75 protein [Thermothelomyces thermophilus ATCC 42464]
MVQFYTVVGALALTFSAVQAAPNLSARQNIPDPAGEKNVGNGRGLQFIGGQCLGAADCASGCCAILPKGGQTIGVCSGVGAQNQAGKQGCGFESGVGAGNQTQGGSQGGNQNNTGGNQRNGGNNQCNNQGDNQNNGQTGATIRPSTLKPDPAGAANVGNGQGQQFIGGECTSDADCASACCALVNTGEERFGICSGPAANTQNGKQVTTARDAPKNLLEFYDVIRAKGHCRHELASGFYSRDNGPNNFAYCGDYLDSAGVIYIQGRSGALANLDVDCDGSSGGPSDDGRCRRELSPDLQNATSFRDVLASYGRAGVAELNPYVHPYVVFGNAPATKTTTASTGRGAKSGAWRAFDPSEYGMRPLGVMAVVCPTSRKLVYGVWGDMNGDDGARPMVGEASLALVTACGGKGVSGADGIDEDAALFLGFTGDEAVPGRDGADWAAKDFDTFERSIERLGNRLVERVRAADEDASCSVRPSWARVAAVAAAVVGSTWSLL